MKQLHPYLQIYLKSNGKFKQVLQHYMNTKKIKLIVNILEEQ